MVRTVARVLIIADGFHDAEIKIPKIALERSGHAVKIAGKTRSKILSLDGTEFLPDFAVYEVNPDYFDAVIVVGMNSGELTDNSNLVYLLRKVALKGKIVAGITKGPLVLAAAGILTGKRATVYPEKEAVRELRESNARYEEEHVVRDGNILTADDHESSEELIREIIKILG
jgi:protease I